MLELVQNKMRYEERSFEKTGFTQVRHSAIDDHAGIENLRANRVAIEFEEFLLRARKFFLSKPGAQYQPQVRKSQKKHQSADMKQEGLDVENLTSHSLDQTRQHQTRR